MLMNYVILNNHILILFFLPIFSSMNTFIFRYYFFTADFLSLYISIYKTYILLSEPAGIFNPNVSQEIQLY
jgi:hypothetical protein